MADRVFFFPLGAEPLGTDGGQAWYGDKDGLGSVSDLSKCFVPGSMKNSSEPGGDELLDLGKQTVHLNAVYSAAATAAIRRAVEVEELRGTGRALGLTDAESDEVVDTWTQWFRTQPTEWSARPINSALISRACGEEWRP